MKFMHRYIRVIDAINHRIGRMAMYLLLVLFAVLVISTGSKFLSYWVEGVRPTNWTLETAQFIMVAYYILGGPYSIQLGANVRMDLFYGNWSDRKKAWVDAFTIFFLIFFLVVLFQGAAKGFAYSLGAHYKLGAWEFFGQVIGSFFTGGPSAAAEHIGRLEVSATAWRPVLWPLKLITFVGLFLMLLQAVSEFFKDILRIKGEAI